MWKIAVVNPWMWKEAWFTNFYNSGMQVQNYSVESAESTRCGMGFCMPEFQGVPAVRRRDKKKAGLTVLFLHTFTIPVLRDIPYL